MSLSWGHVEAQLWSQVPSDKHPVVQVEGGAMLVIWATPTKMVLLVSHHPEG